MAKYEVGQQVAVDSYSTTARYRLGTVEKVTPSGQVVVRVQTRTIRFDVNGREMGATGSRRDRLVEATPAIVTKARREELLSRLKYVRWEDQPLTLLERVVALLDGYVSE